MRENQRVELVGREADALLEVRLRLEQQLVALKRVGRLCQRGEQVGALRQRPAAPDPLHAFERHFRALIEIPAVVRLRSEADADRRPAKSPQPIDPACPEATSVVHEAGMRAELLPGARDKPRPLGRIEIAIGLEGKGLDPLPEGQRALVVAKAGDVDANDLGRVADLMSAVTSASSPLRLRPAR